jgi:Protein of unknown function (DUF2442)
MAAKLIRVVPAGEYRLELTFDDGLRSMVDFKNRVLSHGGVWSPLHDVAFFKQARLDPDLQTVVWPNGVDICPDVLYGLASGRPLPEAWATDAPVQMGRP